jgi:hypothetical protein
MISVRSLAVPSDATDAFEAGVRRAAGGAQRPGTMTRRDDLSDLGANTAPEAPAAEQQRRNVL